MVSAQISQESLTPSPRQTPVGESGGTRPTHDVGIVPAPARAPEVVRDVRSANDTELGVGPGTHHLETDNQESQSMIGLTRKV